MKRFALILALACAAPPLVFAQEARLIVSSRAGDRLAEKRAVRFTPAASGRGTFRLDPSVSYQTQRAGHLHQDPLREDPRSSQEPRGSAVCPGGRANQAPARRGSGPEQRL